MTLVPYGSRLLSDETLITASLFTVQLAGGVRHGYKIMDDAGRVLAEGDVAKTQSGHRNPLHLLRDVLADIDLDALGKDYVKTSYDKSLR